METKQITTTLKFGILAVQGLLSLSTTDDSSSLLALSLAEKINENVKIEAPTALEVSDEEYNILLPIFQRKDVLVKANFLKMVAELNK